MHFSQNVAILYSPASRQAHAEEAKRRNALYRFKGAESVLHWIKGEHAYLAINGLAALLRRLAIKFDLLDEQNISPQICGAYNLIFVPNAVQVSESATAVLAELSGKTRLMISGQTNLPHHLLGVKNKVLYLPKGYISLKNYLLPADATCIISPPGYMVYETTADAGAESISPLVEIFESQTPKKIKGDGMIRSQQGLFLPAPLFEFAGALLQNHIDLQPMLNLLGDARYFYLDQIALFLKELIVRHVWEDFGRTRVRPWGKHENAVILRHDTDSSRESSYLEFEKMKQIPATYPILLDKNGSFWLEKTAGIPFIEQAFHFPTNITKNFGILPAFYARPDKRKITGKGLARQLATARKKFNPAFLTAHRHFSFLYYPESIEAMDFAYSQIPKLIGLGTMFRSIFYRYFFSRHISDRKKVVVEQPDTGVTLWFPFHLQISSLEKFCPLRGWDCSAFMEPDPRMTNLIFENAKLFPGGMYTLIFHPAHTHQSHFNTGGNFEWFRYAVEKAEKEKWWVTTAQDAYQRLSNWENIRIRDEGEKILVHNANATEVEVLVVESGGEKFNLSRMAPRETRELARTKVHGH